MIGCILTTCILRSFIVYSLDICILNIDWCWFYHSNNCQMTDTGNIIYGFITFMWNVSLFMLSKNGISHKLRRVFYPYHAFRQVSCLYRNFSWWAPFKLAQCQCIVLYTYMVDHNLSRISVHVYSKYFLDFSKFCLVFL